jgi:hypothetical protein
MVRGAKMNTANVLILGLACAGLMAIAISCDEVDSATPTCVPGKVEPCPCGGGEPDGTQTCDDDGTWDDCDCGGGDSDTDVDTDADSDSDSDSDTEDGPCDELIALYEEIFEEVCAEFPDCSICEEDMIDTDAEQPSDEECQEALDEFDYDAVIDLFYMVCEQEEEEGLP